MIKHNLLSVGDRVIRSIGIQNEYFRHGSITEVYSGVPNHVGRTDTFYAVRWDDTGLVERGYMEFGLKLEPTVIP